MLSALPSDDSKSSDGYDVGCIRLTTLSRQTKLKSLLKSI